jgi:hypothetical protein
MDDEEIETLCQFFDRQLEHILNYNRLLALYNNALDNAVSMKDFFLRIARGFGDYNSFYTDSSGIVHPLWIYYSLRGPLNPSLYDQIVPVIEPFLYMSHIANTRSDTVLNWHTRNGISQLDLKILDYAPMWIVDFFPYIKNIGVLSLYNEYMRPCLSNRQWKELQDIVIRAYNKFGL